MSGPFATIYVAGLLFTPAVFVTLALLVAVSRRSTAYTRWWIALCLCMSTLWICILLTTRVIRSPDLALVAVRVALTAGTSAAFAGLGFALALLRLPNRYRKLLLVSGAATVALTVLYWTTALVVDGVTRTPYGLTMPVAGPLMPVHGLVDALMISTTLYLIIREFRRRRGRERLQLGYILAALMILGAGALGTLLPTFQRESLLALVPSLLMVAAPTIITYAIIRHQLWDIRTVIHKTLLWGSASAAVIVPVALLLHRAGPRFAAEPPLAALAALLLVAALAMHFRVVQPWLDHRFARGRHDPARVLDAFNHEVVNLRGVGELVDLIDETLRSTVYATEVRVYQAEGEALLPVGQAAPVPRQLTALQRRQLIARGAAIDLAEDDDDPDAARGQAELRERLGPGAALLLPLVHEGALIGIVVLGEKRDLRAYTTADFRVLESVRAAATVALANAQLYDRLQELTGSLETRIEQRTRELQQANRKLLALDRQKSQFFANITHELRTPLTMLLAPLEDLLLDTELKGTDAARELQTMHRNALRLLRQINALLELAKHDAGHLRLRPTPLSLGELAADAVQSFRPLARRKGVSLELAGEDARAAHEILGDGDKLELVLANLLANAVKFTDAGGAITVSLDEDGDRLSLAVRDTGIGIPADQLESVFDRFAQVDDGATRRYEGAGIGLALVKEVVELHRGEVAVTSELGRGSEFRVWLPRQGQVPNHLRDRREADVPTEHARRAEDRDPVAFASGTFELDGDAWVNLEETRPGTGPALPSVGSPRPERDELILIAEDNPDMRAYLGRRLGRLFEVVLCADGQRALQAVAERRPDLIVADVMMPELSGYDLCRALKADPTTAAIPVLLLTAHKSLDRTLEGFSAGADDYLTKPFNLNELLARIEVQLKLVEMGRRLAEQEKGEVLNLVAAGLAHEVRNPVNAILNAVRPLVDTDLLSDPSEESQEARVELLEAIRESAERIDLLCADLLGVSRPEADEISDWRLDEAIDATLRLLRHKNGDPGGAEVRVELGHQQPVFGRTAQLNQVLMNLLDNALRAAGSDGQVTLTTEDRRGTFRLRIADSGPGVPAELRRRIFDPLFTTHARQGAKGLGLHITRRIVEAHRGRIVVGDRPPGGAELTVELPTSLPRQAAEATAPLAETQDGL